MRVRIQIGMILALGLLPSLSYGDFPFGVQPSPIQTLKIVEAVRHLPFFQLLKAPKGGVFDPMSFYYANQASMQPLESMEVLEQRKETFKWNLATYLSDYYVELVVDHGDIFDPNFREVRFLLKQWAQDCDDWFNKRRYEMDCDWLEVNPWERALFQQQLKQLLEGIENGVHDKYINHVVQEIIFDEMWNNSGTKKVINTLRKGFGWTDLSDDDLTTELRKWKQELLEAESSKEGMDSVFPRNDVKAVSHFSEAQNRGDDNGSSKEATPSVDESDEKSILGIKPEVGNQFVLVTDVLTLGNGYKPTDLESPEQFILSRMRLLINFYFPSIHMIASDVDKSLQEGIQKIYADRIRYEQKPETLEDVKKMIKMWLTSAATCGAREIIYLDNERSDIDFFDLQVRTLFKTESELFQNVDQITLISMSEEDVWTRLELLEVLVAEYPDNYPEIIGDIPEKYSYELVLYHILIHGNSPPLHGVFQNQLTVDEL